MALDKVLVRTGIGKLVLLPAGRPATNLCEMYSSNTMRGIIQEMKHRYPDRIILIDTPPILTFAETRILADQADAVILVVRERQCSKNSIQECINLINDKLLGIVYNGAETKDSNDFYYYYYLDEKQ
jgi:receptor protein-tyrosine kinase/non-specific protein-tyrosine kinase